MSHIGAPTINTSSDIIDTNDIINNATTLTNKTTWTMVGFIGAVLCSVIGSIINVFTIYILWLIKNPKIIYVFHKVKRSFIPLLFFLTLADLVMCIFVLPIQAVVIYHQGGQLSLTEQFCKYYIYITQWAKNGKLVY